MKYCHIILVLVFVSTYTCKAQETVPIKKHLNLENDVAIGGYDPVGYFTTGKAVKGSSKFQISFQEVFYYFNTASNKQVFQTNPNKYLPQYGGWCAYAMGDSGEKVEVDPETFKIINGKLYLFYNFYFNNTLKKWNKEENVLKDKADRNWAKIIKT